MRMDCPMSGSQNTPIFNAYRLTFLWLWVGIYSRANGSFVIGYSDRCIICDKGMSKINNDDANGWSRTWKGKSSGFGRMSDDDESKWVARRWMAVKKNLTTYIERYWSWLYFRMQNCKRSEHKFTLCSCWIKNMLCLNLFGQQYWDVSGITYWNVITISKKSDLIKKKLRSKPFCNTSTTNISFIFIGRTTKKAPTLVDFMSDSFSVSFHVDWFCIGIGRDQVWDWIFCSPPNSRHKPISTAAPSARNHHCTYGSRT